ncbi:ABC transporter permease [Modestobacter sp. SYSU DS0290]
MSLRPNGLARASVRARPATFVGAFVALLFASATVAAGALLLQTGVTLGSPPDRYAAAPVVVAAGGEVAQRQGDGWTATQLLAQRPPVDAALAGRLSGLPEVGEVVVDVAVPVLPADDAVLAATGPDWVGRGWSSTVLQPGGPDGEAPAPGAVVLDRATARAAGVAAGDRMPLTTPDGTATFTVAGLVDAGYPAVWFADAQAPALAGHPGRVDALAVLPAAGTDPTELATAVEDALAGAPEPVTGLVVATGDERGQVEDTQVSASRELLLAIGGSLGGVLLMVAVFVVMSTTSLAVEQRGRELALLRAIGATPRQLRRTVAVEAGLVALLAAPLGLVPGVLLTRWLVGAMADRGLLAQGVTVDTGPLALVVTVAVVAGAALLAGLLAARRPARVRPAEALREVTLAGGRIGPLRWVLGLLALAGSVPLMVVSATAPGDLGMGLAATVVLTLLLAVGLLGPVVAAVVARVAQPVLNRFGAPGRLAAGNGLANTRRLGAAITPVVLAVAFAGTMLLLQASTERAADEQARAALVADTVLTTPGAGLPLGVVDDVAAVPGVDAATGLVPTEVITTSAGELLPATAAGVVGDLAGLPRTLDVGLRDGDLTGLAADGTIALDTLLADSLDAGVGDRVAVFAADGTPLEPEVVAVYSRGLGVASALLPVETVRQHAAAPLLGQLLVRHDGPVTDSALADLRAAAGPGTEAVDAAVVAEQRQAATDQGSWLNDVVAAGLAGFATIAAANTLVMIALSRRREVGLLRMIGATRRQVLRTARLEALVVAGAGLLLGGGIAWGTLQPSVRGATGAGPYLPWPVGTGIVVGVAAVALLCTWLPSRAVLRAPRTVTD